MKRHPADIVGEIAQAFAPPMCETHPDMFGGFAPKWQPIDTAPRDGSGVLVIDMNCENPTAGSGFWRDGKWSAIDPDDDPTNELAHVIVWVGPTHWMPLPEPPK